MFLRSYVVIVICALVGAVLVIEPSIISHPIVKSQGGGMSQAATLSGALTILGLLLIALAGLGLFLRLRARD